MTCLIVPSLPAASMAWKTSRTAQQLRIQHVLEMTQRLDAQREHLLRAWLVLGPEIERVGGVEVLQPEPVAVRDPERLRECGGLLDGVLDFHGSTPHSHPMVSLRRHPPLRRT